MSSIAQPLTGEPLIELPVSGPADVASAYERARTAQRAWAELSPAWRPSVARLSPAERAKPVVREVRRADRP